MSLLGEGFTRKDKQVPFRRRRRRRHHVVRRTFWNPQLTSHGARMIIGVVLRESSPYRSVEQIASLRCWDLGCSVIALLLVIV